MFELVPWTSILLLVGQGESVRPIISVQEAPGIKMNFAEFLKGVFSTYVFERQVYLWFLYFLVT